MISPCTGLRCSGATRTVTTAAWHGGPSSSSSSSASASAALAASAAPSPSPSPPPPPRRDDELDPPVPFLRPLLSAVVAVSAGRLGSLPPALLVWLLRLLGQLGPAAPPPGPGWLGEAYAALAGWLPVASPGLAAQAFVAICGLAGKPVEGEPGSGSGSGSSAAAGQQGRLLLLPAPPRDLLTSLYGRIADGCRRGELEPRLALQCLEAAADAAAAELGGAVPSSAGGAAAVGAGAPGSAGAGAYGRRAAVLQPLMPRDTAEALLLRAAGLMAASGSSGMGGSGGGGAAAPVSPSAAAAAVAAASRGLVAAATLASPPGGPALGPLAAHLAEQGALAYAGGSHSGGSSRSDSMVAAAVAAGARPDLYLDGLAALCASAAPPLQPPAATELLRSLEALLPSLTPVQVCRAVAAASWLAAPSQPDAAAAFTGGPAAAALAAALPGMPAPQLTETLAALPPALRPAPAELAAAAAEGLRRCLATSDSDDLAEVLRRMQEADALPGYGWQGAVAAEASRRLQEQPPRAAGSGAAGAASAAATSSLLPPPLSAGYRCEFVATLYVLAALGYRPGTNWTGVAVAALAPAQLYALSAGQLTSVLWALARFGHRAEPGPWSTAAVQALQLQLPALAPHQLSYGLGSLQRLGCRLAGPVLDELLEAAAAMISGSSSSSVTAGGVALTEPAAMTVAGGGAGAAAAGGAGSYSAPDLVLLLMTVARLQHVPSYAFTEAVTERLRPHIAAAAAAAAATSARYPSAGGTGGSSSSSSSSGVGGSSSGGLTGPAAAPQPQPQPVAARGAPVVVAMAGPGGELLVVEPLTCQELASVGYALAKLHSRPESDWLSQYMEACQAVMGGFEADHLASLLWAVGELGQTPSPGWLSSFLAAARPRLPAFAPPDLVSVLSSLAALRAPPPAAWLGEALTAVGARVGGLDGAGVAALLKALVDLDARVSNPEWYDALCSQVSGFLPLLRPAELASLVSSLAALGHTPGKEWLQRASAAALRAHAISAAAASAAAAAAARQQQQQQQQQEQQQQEGGSAAAFQSQQATAGAASPGFASSFLPTGLSGLGGAASFGSGGGGGGPAGVVLSPGQLEALVLGLAKLGAEVPAPLLQSYMAAGAASLPQQPPDRVAAAASALAGARLTPTAEWLDALVGAVRRDVMSYTLVQLDALSRAVAVFVELVPEHGPTRDLLSFLREFCLYN
ncbi:hypothetical protein HYH02_002977 [Chlamydomonas schloesseri]|uniref:Uncharacterized protein n=1 Tax=Chlamydomonas schloesseri TaxID=2026947 RepID=A0A835WSQ1_9CHLO|nr:hypothetical protein HYH02_002977 [Chlamydomonas schloesseri]|eukprot:KAG2452747.1 hypothetical protein HYH02_002977 [Chlamydomonas schloesseri]